MQAYKRPPLLNFSQSLDSDLGISKTSDHQKDRSKERQAHRKIEKDLKIASDRNQHQKLSVLVNKILTDKIDQVNSARFEDIQAERQLSSNLSPVGMMRSKKQAYTDFTGREFHIKGTNIQIVPP